MVPPPLDDGAVTAATVARLPQLLRSLVDLAGTEVATVSSERLADLSGVNAATVRRDLGSLGIGGTRGVGYDVKYLVHEISVVLGLHQEWPVVIVGVGNIGRALANYDGLSSRGFPVRALVDADPELIGTQLAGITIDSMDRLPALVAERDLTVGVIATPPDAAQHVAEELVAAGLSSLLNFTATPLSMPEDIQVRRVDLATELQILSFYRRRTAAARTGTGLPLGRIAADPAPEGS